MGSPISGLITELVMLHFQQQALQGDNMPKLWLRYVDDTFTIIKRDSFDRFPTHINSIISAIQFTHELKQSGFIAFLDVGVTRATDRHLSTQVYRKPTHTDRELNDNNGHLTMHKQSCARTLFDQVKSYCSDQDTRQTEIKHVTRLLQNNDYPTAFIQSCHHKWVPTR